MIQIFIRDSKLKKIFRTFKDQEMIRTNTSVIKKLFSYNNELSIENDRLRNENKLLNLKNKCTHFDK